LLLVVVVVARKQSALKEKILSGNAKRYAIYKRAINGAIHEKITVVASRGAGVVEGGDYVKKIVSRVEASLTTGVRWPDEPTAVFGVTVPPPTTTGIIGGGYAQWRGRIQQIMDGVRSAQQQWHANPLVCAGVYPNDLSQAIKLEYAAQHQVPLAMDAAQKLKGRVTNKQLKDTIIIQSREWFCEAIRAMRGSRSADGHDNKKNLFKTGWFFIGNILHTVQDSYSEAHTMRAVPDAFHDNGGDYKGRCTDDIMRQMIVQRFLGMDFTKYSAHKPADNVKGKDRWRDCARQASKGLIARFKPFSDKTLANTEITRDHVVTAIQSLTAFLRDDVWPIAFPARPAGGSTDVQGTAAIALPDDALVTEAELETYLEEHIRAQADAAVFQNLQPNQKAFLRGYRYAARTPERRVLEGSAKYYHQFTMADDDAAFHSCGGIMNFEDAVVKLEDEIQIIPEEAPLIDLEADEEPIVASKEADDQEFFEMFHDREDEIVSDEYTSLLG